MDDGAVGELQPQVVAIAEHLHTGAMLVVVMERAPQGHVDQIGGPAVFVRDQVVDFAPGCGDVAIRPAAAAIACEQRPILRGSGVAHLAAEVEHDGASVEHALQVGVLRQVAHHMGGDAVAVVGDAGFVVGTGERRGVDGDENGGLLATTAHLALGVGPAQLHEPVGQALFGGASVALARLAGDGRDGVVELA